MSLFDTFKKGSANKTTDTPISIGEKTNSQVNTAKISSSAGPAVGHGLENGSNRSVIQDNNITNELSPPKSLPDLAKDMFSLDADRPAAREPQETIQEKNVFERRSIAPLTSKDVPKLDLNLLKSYYSENQSNQSDSSSKSGFTDSNAISFSSEKTPSNQSRSPDLSPEILAYLQNLINQPVQNKSSGFARSSLGNPSFFEDFRLFLFSNQSNVNEILSRLDSSALLLKMKAYHSQTGDIFTELTDLERLWQMIEKRKSAVNELTISIESEISQKLNSLLSSKNSAFTQPSANSNVLSAVSNDATVGLSYSATDDKLRDDRVIPFANLLKQKNIDRTSENVGAVNTILDIESLERLRTHIVQDGSRYFYFVNGAVAKSLRDVITILESYADNVFYYHVNDAKNDIANWIEHVFDNSTFASKVRSIKTKAELIAYLKNTLFP